MKNIWLLLFALTALVSVPQALAVKPPAAFKRGSDLRLVNYKGRWAGDEAVFSLTRNTIAKFWGRIYLTKRGITDTLFIEQYTDNSLRIIRYLSGKYEGQTQVAQTFTPQRRLIDGKEFYEFKAEGGWGIGMKGTYTHLILPVR